MPYSYEERYRIALAAVEELDIEVKAMWKALIEACDGNVFKALYLKEKKEKIFRKQQG